MNKIPQNDILANMPIEELEAEIRRFVRPVTTRLPDQRLAKVVCLAVQAISSGQSPIITRMARGLSRANPTIWALAKRLYRFLAKERLSHDTLLEGLYDSARQTVEPYAPAYVVVALDPVNFEKPSTHKLAGVSTVMKNTPPPLNQKKRLTKGYPAMTATVVNLPIPAVPYASWFSYTLDFVSQNCEIEAAITTTRKLLPTQRLRFVGDAGLDDQKLYQHLIDVKAEGIIRAYHNRTVEVYNERLHRWEANEALLDLAESVPLPVNLLVEFTHARKTRQVKVQLGWLRLRIVGVSADMWALVIHHPDEDRNIVLLTNVAITSAAQAHRVYDQWRHRPQIEHTYRFDQEAGLDVEDMRVHSLETMRRLFVLVLLTALFVTHIAATWPEPTLSWLRCLGGKLGLKTDLEGLYLL